jgi:proteasome lid subunit RPN8/RPN11
MRIVVPERLLSDMMEMARDVYPRETILLLRGNRDSGEISVTEYLFPPFGAGGRGFATFPAHMLPIDFSIVGTAHSHPSGNLTPSVGDLHNFYGRVMMILGPPFTLDAVRVYGKGGEELEIYIARE